MAVDERSRHALYSRLEDVLGPDAATTLIEHLPPVGWADVATKGDLATLEERIELRFDRVDDRFARVDDRFARVDDRFAQVDERFDRVDERFDRVDERFDRVDERFDHMEEWLGERFKSFSFELRAVFEHELRAQVLTMVFGLVGVVMTMAALVFALVRFTSS
ncbi:MAG: hypothetical protein ACR2HM_03030 [Acidimicrobiales bacterium]